MDTKFTGSACVVCGDVKAMKSSIFASRLWDEGEEPQENLTLLCQTHAEEARKTLISVERLAELTGLTTLPLPPQLHSVENYDRWGNPIIRDGRRARGELFFENEVQGWLRRGQVLDRFEPWVKYPRTYVLPWSQEIGVGDRALGSLTALKANDVIVTEKMDGENVSLYRNFLHTRSIARIPHESRAWLDEFWESIKWKIPDDWRICGEYLFVKHTVSYSDLPTFFLAFSVWNERNVCLSWDETLDFLSDAGIAPVPVLYQGPFDQPAIHEAWKKGARESSEGYILRTAAQIPYGHFRRRVAKFIRKGYVQSEPIKDNFSKGTIWESNNLGQSL